MAGLAFGWRLNAMTLRRARPVDTERESLEGARVADSDSAGLTTALDEGTVAALEVVIDDGRQTGEGHSRSRTRSRVVPCLGEDGREVVEEARPPTVEPGRRAVAPGARIVFVVGCRSHENEGAERPDGQRWPVRHAPRKPRHRLDHGCSCGIAWDVIEEGWADGDLLLLDLREQPPAEEVLPAKDAGLPGGAQCSSVLHLERQKVGEVAVQERRVGRCLVRELGQDGLHRHQCHE